ncbi:MAG: YbjN domain-containing protein [Salinivirgaceae bacterium]
MTDFEKVKSYLIELEYTILSEDIEEELFVVEKEDAGISNLIIDCEGEILIIEQLIMELPVDRAEVYKDLLIKNREIVHGAFVLADDGKSLIFRDTLQLKNLDLNELEGTLNSLALLLGEYGETLINISKLK